MWTDFEYIYVAQSVDWETAEDNCVEWGGHLASIHSDEELDVVSSIVPKMKTMAARNAAFLLQNCIMAKSWMISMPSGVGSV